MNQTNQFYLKVLIHFKMKMSNKKLIMNNKIVNLKKIKI